MVHGDLHDANVLITPGGAKVIDLLYTHSLVEVGTRTAARTRKDDVRALSVLARQILSKAGKQDSSLEETFFQASTGAESATEVGRLFTVAIEPQDNPAPRGAQVSSKKSVKTSAHKSGSQRHLVSTEATAIVTSIYSRTVPLSACVAEALAFAVKVGDLELKKLCERELFGYGQAGVPAPPEGGPRKIDVAEDVDHRAIEFLVAISIEVNIDHFGSAQRAFDWMKTQPDKFSPIKLVYPEPISKIEQAARTSSSKALLSLRLKASDLIANTSIPNAILTCYARGDALSDLMEGLRTTLASKILRHVTSLESLVPHKRN